jgi:hypothetical protein
MVGANLIAETDGNTNGEPYAEFLLINHYKSIWDPRHPASVSCAAAVRSF